MKSVMQHQFSRVPKADIPRSQFSRSHGRKQTFDSGYLIPIYADEVLPGDTFNLSLSHLTRLSTPTVPIMDNLKMDFFFFFVPNRLLWTNWKRFNGEQDNPTDSTDYTVPVMDKTKAPLSTTGFVNESLFDYLGMTTQVSDIEPIALYSRAYNLIWNEWFRDQNLQDSVTVDKDNGPDDPADYVLLKRGKRHDYFTSCLPNPQKGEEVKLPLGDSAPVLGIGKKTQAFPEANMTVYESNGATETYDHPAYIVYGGGSTDGDYVVQGTADTGGYPNIYADLSNAVAASVNDMREAVQIQKLYERDSRSGSRYTEIIKSHFGISDAGGDARLQRPEYLGGGTSNINVNPVVQQSETGSTPQGNLAAFGVGGGTGIGFTKSFTEHGIIIGLSNVRADLTYQQGLDRQFSRDTRFDYYWPALSHIGEQPVYNKEIYAQGTSADDDVFGYQERYAEYRYKNSLVCGKMRSNDANSLDVWHLSQDFGSLPTLNATFIQEAPPISRVVAVQTEPEFITDMYFDIKCVRPMPVYSVPGMMDHF